jgi:hypothetical protein
LIHDLRPVYHRGKPTAEILEFPKTDANAIIELPASISVATETDKPESPARPTAQAPRSRRRVGEAIE